MDRVWMNGDLLMKTRFDRLLAGLLEPDAAKANGGYLFKLSLDRAYPRLALAGAFVNGERSHHYDMSTGPEGQPELVGGIAPNLEFTALFREKEWNEVIALSIGPRYRELYGCLAALLPERYRERMKPDWITLKLLAECGLFERQPHNALDFLAFAPRFPHH